MSRPIVHIGYPKTATTWFQREFYPHVSGRNYVERNRLRQALLSENALTFEPERARELLSSGGPGDLLICEEGLSGYLHNGGVLECVTRDFADRLYRTLPDADIVVLLRSQPAIIASTYQQYVRAGGTHSAKRYLFPHSYVTQNHREQYKVPLQDVSHFDYRPLIRYYRTLYGPERVHALLYEAFERNRDAFLQDFTTRLGMAADWSAINGGRRLEAYSYPVHMLARLCNLFTYRAVSDKRCTVHIPGWYRLQRKLLTCLDKTGWFGPSPEPSRVLGEDVVRWLEHRFAQPNRELAELTGLPLAENGWVLDAPEAPFPVPDSRWRRWSAH
jgi:hypothetical protein